MFALIAAGPWPVFFGLAGITVLLLLSGLVSGSEVAFFSLDDGDYKEIDEHGTLASKRLLTLRDAPRRLLATILIANNFINIAIVLLSEWLLKNLLPEEFFWGWGQRVLRGVQGWGRLAELLTLGGVVTAIRLGITVVAVTFLLVLFGEVAPKVYARYNKLRLALFMAGPMTTMMGLFSPLSGLLVSGAAGVERRFENRSAEAPFSSEEIDDAIDLTVQNEERGEEGPRQDADILKRIVQFAGVTVRQVMRARGDVVAVDQAISYGELLASIREHSYSRIPVFREDFDRVVGVLYVKDLLGHRKERPDFDWNQLVRPDILYVPENKKISDLLREFQQEKMHLAIVVDEYGGTEGIVTLEDVLEEVIGDIQDEFDDTDEIIYTRIDDLNYVFDGKTLLNDVCRILELPTNTFDEVKGEAESLAGLLLELLGHFPVPDQEVDCAEYKLTVMKMNPRRVEEILITLPEPTAEE